MQNITKKTLIDAMVSRFLAWKLPGDFGPDCGVSFKKSPHLEVQGPYWPSGTNLLHAGQAREMIEHLLGDAINPAALDVLTERRRQVDAEGWTPEHDDAHVNDEIAALACFYAMLPNSWVASTGDRRRELVKAGALILAEIERLDRTQPPKGGD